MAYKYGAATVIATAIAILFAGGAEWLGIQNSFVFDLLKGTRVDNLAIQLTILMSGIVIFAIFTIIAYQEEL